MNKKAILLLTVLFLSFIPIIKADTEWVDSSFRYRNVYAIDSDLIDEELYDFPVLVYLNSSYVSWDRVNDDLSDLRFYNVSGSLLSHELQSDYTVNDEAWLWVKIPYINNVSDTYFFMYYGCFYAESVENKTDVWDSNFVMVQHMNDDPDTDHIKDSTSNGNNGTKKGVNEPIEATGKIGKAQDFAGDDDIVNMGDVLDVGTDELTLTAWIKIDPTEDTRSVILTKLAGDGSTGYMFAYESNSKLRFWVGADTGVNDYSDNTVSKNVWHFVVARYNGTHITIFVDGSEDIVIPTAVTGNIVENANDFVFGDWISEGAEYWGIMDEVTVSNSARSSAWVGASYETQTLNLISLENTEFYNTEYLAFSIIAIVIAMFSFVMVITIKEKRK